MIETWDISENKKYFSFSVFNLFIYSGSGKVQISRFKTIPDPKKLDMDGSIQMQAIPKYHKPMPKKSLGRIRVRVIRLGKL